MSHLEEGTLHALLDGEIPSSELAPVMAHLAGCAECRTLLEEARSLAGEALAMVESLGDGVAPVPASMPDQSAPVPNPWPRYRRLAWAATVVMAAGLGYWLRSPVAPTGSSLEGAIQEAPGAPADLQSRADTLIPTDAGDPAGAAPVPPPVRRDAGTRELQRQARGSAPDSSGGRLLARDAGAETSPPVGQPELEAAKLAESRARRDALGTGGLLPPAANLQAMPAAPRPAFAAGERAELAGDEYAPIGFPEAIARLGGSLRLVDGLVPDRLEASANAIRVVYLLQTGDLVLEQRRMGDSIAVVLRGPVSADSLAALRRRVR